MPEKQYNVDGNLYEIPENEVDGFLKDFPKAQEVKVFISGSDTLGIPVQEVDDFVKEVPEAKEYSKTGIPEVTLTEEEATEGVTDYQGNSNLRQKLAEADKYSSGVPFIEEPMGGVRDERQKEKTFDVPEFRKEPNKVEQGATELEDVPTSYATPESILATLGGVVPAPTQDVDPKKAMAERHEKKSVQEMNPLQKISEAIQGNPEVLAQMQENWYGKPLAAQIETARAIGHEANELSTSLQELGLNPGMPVPINRSGRNKLESGIHAVASATRGTFATLMTITPTGMGINIVASELPREVSEWMFSPLTKVYEKMNSGLPESEWGQDLLGIGDAVLGIFLGAKVDPHVRTAAKKILKREATPQDVKTVIDNGSKGITAEDISNTENLLGQLEGVPQEKQVDVLSLKSEYDEALLKAESAPDAFKKAFQDKAKKIEQQISDALNKAEITPKAEEIKTPEMAEVVEAPEQPQAKEVVSEKITTEPPAVNQEQTIKSEADVKEEIKEQDAPKGEDVLSEGGGEQKASVVSEKEIGSEAYYKGHKVKIVDKRHSDLTNENRVTVEFDNGVKAEINAEKLDSEYPEGKDIPYDNQLLNKGNTNEQVYYKGTNVLANGDKVVEVEYHFTDGKKKADTRYVPYDEFDKRYIPITKAEFNKVKKSAKEQPIKLGGETESEKTARIEKALGLDLTSPVKPEKVKTPKEKKAISQANKTAADNGFDDATHLLNSVRKRTGEEYKNVQDVPQETLDKVIAERKEESEIQKAYEERDKELKDFKKNAVDFKSQLIHDHFAGITEADWTRYGDKNWLKGKEGKVFRRKYINNKAEPLDTQTFGQPEDVIIEPSDVIEYIKDHEFNKNKYRVGAMDKQWLERTKKIAPDTDIDNLLTFVKEKGFDASTEEAVNKLRDFPLTDAEADLLIEYLKSDEGKKELSDTTPSKAGQETSQPLAEGSGVETKTGEPKPAASESEKLAAKVDKVNELKDKVKEAEKTEAEPTPDELLSEDIEAALPKKLTVYEDSLKDIARSKIIKGAKKPTYTRQPPKETGKTLRDSLFEAVKNPSKEAYNKFVESFENAFENPYRGTTETKKAFDQLHKTFPELEKGREVKVAGQTEKAYENIAGLAPNNQPGRIPVSPIIGSTPKQISDIIFDVTKAAKQRLFFSKPDGSRSRVIGTYNPGNTAVKIKFAGDLDVTAHELGHSIDDHFSILGDLANTPNLPVESELLKFSDYGSKPPKNHPNPKMYEYGEGFAEWLRAYIVNPQKAISEAPNVYDLYVKKTHPEYQKAIDDFSRDIREWAGSSGRDMVLSNVQWTPKENKGVIGQILSKSEPNNMFAVTWADRVAANFLNPLRAFNKANEYAKGIKGIDKQLPENDPSLLARTLLGVDGKVSEILESGMIDADLNVLKSNGKPKNLQWLLEPLDNTDMTSVERDIKDVASYMIAERTVELSGKFGRDDILSGIGGGVFKDVDVARKALDEFNNGDPARLERIKEAASRYRELADDVLKYMVDKGRLSKESYDKIKADNVQYVALNRIIEAEPNREIEVFSSGGGSLGSKTEVVKKITGSTRQIQNPYTSLLDMIYKGVKESDRNETLLAFRNLLVPERVDMYDGEPMRLADIGVRAKAADKETITIFVDGKPEYWKFQTDIYKALKGLDSDVFKLPSVVTALPRVLRWTVTNFPVFAARNVVRDFQDRLIKSNENDYKNFFGVKDLVGDKEHWHEVARAGGLNAGYYLKDRTHYYGLLREAMHDISKNQKFVLADGIKLKEGWDGYKNLLQKSETVNRVAEYRAAYRNAKAKGMDDYNAKLYAGLRSRDLIDFALMGHWMKVVNQVIPFSNAAVQGLRSAATRAKENPAGFTSRMVAFSVIPSVALWLLNHQDEETEKQYEELPSYQRDLFYNLKIGDNKWLVIPKPFELSLLGSGVDRAMSAANGKKDAFEGYAGSVAKTTMPFDEASFAGGFQSIIEGITNYDFFREKNIVPQYEDGLALSLRNTEHASRLGKSLQEVSGIDARKIDHFIQGQLSYYGKTAIELSDMGRKGKSFSIGDLGFFKQSPAYNSKSVQEYLKTAQEYQINPRAFSNMAKAYFNAETDAEKELLGQRLVSYAERELPHIKQMAELKEKRKAKKKNLAKSATKTVNL